jgi:hypothetical protein
MPLGLNTLLAIASTVGSTAPTAAKSSEFFQLYAVTCLANAFTPEKLKETLDTPLTPKLSKEQAIPFLGGSTGTAWQVHFGKGQYALALTDTNVCIVYARHAPIKTVTAEFIQFASRPPSPLKSKQLPPQEAGPNTGDLTSTAFDWNQPGKQLAVRYILTTSISAVDPEIQAMASVTVGRPEP